MKNNEKSLNIIWSKEFVYFLGYLWSDGTVKRNVISIEIIEEDGIEIFKEFQKIEFIKFNLFKRHRKSFNRNYKPQMMLYFCNAKLYDTFFGKYFIKKSTNSPCELLNLIPNNLLNYFYLGLIDGDGCFYISPNLKTKQFSISSSYDQNWDHIKNLFKILNIEQYEIKKVITKNGKSSLIRINKYSEIEKLFRFLYPHGFEFGLKRKFTKCEMIINNKPKTSVNKSKIDIIELINFVNNNKNIEEIVNIYKCGYKKIYNLLEKNKFFKEGFNKPKIKKLKKDEYMNYNESLIYIQQFNLKNKMEWNNFCKNGNRPTNIPSNPYDFYKGIGWTTWGEWLGFK